MSELLFLAQRVPYPPNKGEKIRAYRLLEHLSRRYEVFLGCCYDDPADRAEAAPLEEICAEVKAVPLAGGRLRRCWPGLLDGRPLSLPYFYDRDLARWVGRILDRRPAKVVVYSSAMAQYLLDWATARGGKEREATRLLMDFVDVDSDKWQQYAEKQSWPLSWVYRREARLLAAFDRQVAAAADVSLFVSEPEAALFRRLAPESAAKVHAIGNGVDHHLFDPAGPAAGPAGAEVLAGADVLAGAAESNAAAGPLVVFTGTMDYWPNVDAVTWFAEAVWPAVRAARPAARFIIVGASPAPEVTALDGRDGISVTGRVDKVQPYLARADLAVAPIRVARGVQNKVLEAMAMARPVVVTAKALEGIDATPGRDLVLAGPATVAAPEDAAAIAAAILELLANPTKAAALGQAARTQILARHTWQAKLAALDALVE